MLVNYKGKQVDVCDETCLNRTCFWLGQDKGSYVPGRGYTSYHKNPRWVCMRRHLHGCPEAGMCTACKTVYIPGQGVCTWCGASLDEVGKGLPCGFKLVKENPR